MPRWMRGHRRCRGRPPIEIRGSLDLSNITYVPIKGELSSAQMETVELYNYEIEALKLIHLDGLSTDEAANRMGVSKATFWRVLETARAKIAEALYEGKAIKIISASKPSEEM